MSYGQPTGAMEVPCYLLRVGDVVLYDGQLREVHKITFHHPDEWETDLRVTVHMFGNVSSITGQSTHRMVVMPSDEDKLLSYEAKRKLKDLC